MDSGVPALLGIALGSYVLAEIHPGWLIFATYALIPSLIVRQAAS